MANGKNILIIIAVLALLFFVVPKGSVAGGSSGSTETSCQTTLAQTLAVAAYDADKPGTLTGATTIVPYLNADTGAKYPGANSTQQLGTYDILVQKANYQSVLLKGYRTGCGATDAPSVSQKQFDTGVTVAVFNTNGVTANTQTGNNTIGSSGSATFHIKLSQSAAYKHIGGVNNQVVFWVNSTNQSDWDGSQESMVVDGTPCTTYSGKQPNAISGGVVKNAFLCTFDFAPNDGTLHDVAYKANAASGVNPDSQQQTVSFAPVDYYVDTISSKVALGPVKNDGSAIVALQTATLYSG